MIKLRQYEKVLFFDGTSPILRIKNTQNDTYIDWLNHQDCPPKSYREHPFSSENALNEYKKMFEKTYSISLGAYIRIKRIIFILNNTNSFANNQLFYSFVATPLGIMIAIASEKGLCLLEFLDRKMLETELNEITTHFQSNLIFQKTTVLIDLEQQVNEYFNHKRTAFDIPLDWVGTDFQIKTWEALLAIGYGETMSYSKQAKMMSCPNATRAVASANGRNKISIVVPCHRILRADNSLGGYSGGINRKKYLIGLESNQIVFDF